MGAIGKTVGQKQNIQQKTKFMKAKKKKPKKKKQKQKQKKNRQDLSLRQIKLVVPSSPGNGSQSVVVCVGV